MRFKMDGYFDDGKDQAIRVIGYDDNGVRVFLYKGYTNWRHETVTLYPHQRLRAGSEDIRKVTIPLRELGREGFS